MLADKYKFSRHSNYMLSCIIFTVLMMGIIPLGQTSFNSEAAAVHKEYETEGFSVNITIPKDTYKSVDISFITGNSLEVVYTLQVKDNLPVDAWFVNNDNYILLSGDAQFLYFMDGTDQQVSYMKRIVTLTKYDNYKLVVTNYYANQTVEVNIFGEVRTYSDAFPNDPTQWLDSDGDMYGDNPNGTNPDAFPNDPTQWLDSDGDNYGDNPNGIYPDHYPNDPTKWKKEEDQKEETTEYPQVMYYSLAAVIVIIIILLIIVIIFYDKLNEAGQGIDKDYGKQPSKKPKNKPKAGSGKVKPKPETHKRTPVKKSKPAKEKVKPAKKGEVDKDTVEVMFCGHCGAPTDTTFCKKCGKKA